MIPETSFKDVLKKLAFVTGDYPEVDDDDLDEIKDIASLLDTRIKEAWEYFDWDQLCDIHELPLIVEGNFKYFVLPENFIFHKAYSVDPRLFDVGVYEFNVRVYADKHRVSMRAQNKVFARLQKSAPDFLAKDGYEKMMPKMLEQAVVELAYSDKLTQDGQLGKAMVRQQNGYSFIKTEIEKQTKTRPKNIKVLS